MFALEDVSSFWSRELTWRTFFGMDTLFYVSSEISACMISAFTVNLIFSINSSASTALIRDYGILTFGLNKAFLYRYIENEHFFS